MDSKQYNDLFLEFCTIGNELDEMSLFFLKKVEQDGRISHRPKVQWTGIVGAIQDSREEKKRIAFLNEPIYKGKSFGQLAFIIMDKTDVLVEKALLLQQETPKTDAKYYAIGKMAFDYTTNAAGAWHNYAPEAAELPIRIGDQKDVGLWLSVKSEVEEQLLKLDLTDDLKKQLQPEQTTNNDSSGCMSVIVALIAISSPLFYFVFS